MKQKFSNTSIRDIGFIKLSLPRSKEGQRKWDGDARADFGMIIAERRERLAVYIPS